MVTIKVEIREGLFVGFRTEVSVSRPTVAGALAAVTIAVIGRTSLTLAEMLAALRHERGVAAGSRPDRFLGDPLGLARKPLYERRPNGAALALGVLIAGLRGVVQAVEQNSSAAQAPAVARPAPAETEPSGPAPLKPTVAGRLARPSRAADRHQPPTG